MGVGLRTFAAGLSLAAALVATGASAQRVPFAYGRRADPLLESRFKVFEIDWRQQLVERGLLEYEPREIAGPAVDDLTGEIVVATRDGVVRLLTPTGREIWRTSIGAAATGTPLLTDEAIYLGGADGSLHAVARFDGAVLWSTFVAAEVLEKPVVDGGLVFVGTDHDAVHALDERTGESRWVYRRDTGSTLSVRGGTGVSIGAGRLYAGFSDGAVVALSPEDGRLLWQSQLARSDIDKFPDSDAVPVYREGTLYVTVYNEGTWALDAENGKPRWQADTRGATSLTLDDDLLFVGGADAWALHAGTGAVVWTIDLGKGWTTQPLVVKKLVVLSGDPGMMFVERSTGRPLRVFDPGSEFASAPAARGSEIYALSNLGYFYALRTALKP
ncbi:PQQ-binding-like beta-propeller repeat protein [Vulgatibacter sp.]|uniref:outer membrane protein assembly factor BamB family protein n=1 Tax=Vulgatibacter sp. TaxID=1971226 RepID=UPI003566AB49